MIGSWKSKTAQAIFLGRDPGKGFPADLVAVTRRRLARLDEATQIEDLASPPGHRLHRLSGDRSNQWSISVNMQWRICFDWTETGPINVEIVDYH
jgi:proteic killer suppression protein